ncbi:DUF1501 domain-containing protein, partial [bacterium]|nr:DUF1501 domain-containing protein [bacterium]
MLNLHARGSRLCDGVSRREVLRIGSLGLTGLALPELLRAQRATASDAAPRGKARACIVLFLMGGPPQHSTWDPKPDAPAEVRGEFGPIATTVPGLQICELLPCTARLAEHLCVLRAVSSGDNAHSSSGYYMMTGHPHTPMNFENANPGAPNDHPNLGAVVRRLRDASGPAGLPAAVRLPHRIFNTDASVWPGQDAGYLGRRADPWLFTCEPASPAFRVPDFALPADVTADRLGVRRSLLDRVNRRLDAVDPGGFDRQTQQALDLVGSPAARRAFHLDDEPPRLRD